MISIPHLQIKTSGDLVLGLIPGEHGLFLRDNNFLFSHEVVKWVDKAPVEVALPSDGVVVDICILLVLLLPFQPTGGKAVGSGRNLQCSSNQATGSFVILVKIKM